MTDHESPWESSPFERQAGDFWDPRFPNIRYPGIYFAEMDLPFVETIEATRPDRDWGLRSIAGVLADGREVLLLAHEGTKHSFQVVRDGDQRYDRYTGVGALIGGGATSTSEQTLVRSATLRVQNLAKWMGANSSEAEVIGTGFMNSVDVPEITAVVDRKSRLLTIDLGAEVPLRQALTLLDEAQFLARKAIGCLTGVRSIAREQRIHTASGQTFVWKYARWEAPLREPISSSQSVSMERSGPAGTLVNRFQQARQSLWPIADVLYVNLPSPDVYSEHRFVSLISAVEGAHANLDGAIEKRRWTGAQATEFKDAREALKLHFEGNGSAAMRSELLVGLKNERTFAQKLNDVFDAVGDNIEARLRIDRAAWIKLATTHRNVTAHAATTSTPQSDTADDSAKYRALSIVAEELLRQLLLLKMEIDEEVRESSATRAGSNLRGTSFNGFLAQ
ncbi:HEPN domain-containing protein [Paenarthrobacter nitroguajacolicus]|uniref:HEPN domain-containing protein n=1 Tax=Paenarthrobacter nitroguajacolicus TaxID=211146 RepID=UPI00285D9B1C|nr:HEPN domain-containing protein [Paenarthrobacter nitroguajacolicus]MDR6637084.1 hypothetical protein [Paenarthrobacter nitroguajacolicus]